MFLLNPCTALAKQLPSTISLLQKTNFASLTLKRLFLRADGYQECLPLQSAAKTYFDSGKGLQGQERAWQRDEYQMRVYCHIPETDQSTLQRTIID